MELKAQHKISSFTHLRTLPYRATQPPLKLRMAHSAARPIQRRRGIPLEEGLEADTAVLRPRRLV
jgi:hypothetical protein